MRDIEKIVSGYFNDPDYKVYMNEDGGFTVRYEPQSSKPKVNSDE